MRSRAADREAPEAEEVIGVEQTDQTGEASNSLRDAVNYVACSLKLVSEKFMVDIVDRPTDDDRLAESADEALIVKSSQFETQAQARGVKDSLKS
jgi:hypothetical protein